MKVQANQLLKEEQFPEQKTWIGPMFYLINRFINTTLQAINGGLEIGENIEGRAHIFEFTFQSSSATFPIEFFWPLKKRPSAFNVVHAFEDGSEITAICQFDYTQEGFVRLTNALKVNYSSPGLSALTAGSFYRIYMHVMPFKEEA